mgnify:CR=1 FL=1
MAFVATPLNMEILYVQVEGDAQRRMEFGSLPPTPEKQVHLPLCFAEFSASSYLDCSSIAKLNYYVK